ncbi:hypothetical protein SRAA_1243 [Serpentinimonas raichei]|uniref:FOG: EAL domain n=2 Tax=Serpentinimonas raichei TaxID=1458425 RepID=A0A060NIE9_9BURK|nr:hypothetical protein SRAA_1243 [Serpentinimonas raichei]
MRMHSDSLGLAGQEQICSIRELIDSAALRVHFQPIVDLAGVSVYAHEALVRPPPNSPWNGPLELLASAQSENLTLEFELECLFRALWCWSRSARVGRLFLNISASVLVKAAERQQIVRLFDHAQALGLSLSSLVLELTEHEQVVEIDAIQSVIERLRRHGGALALDDFGDGRSSLRLWSELHPEYVKIDKYFVRDVNQHSHKLQTVQALSRLAEIFGAKLVAEGIETADELEILRDLGLPYAQGFYLGRPQADPVTVPLPDAERVLSSRQISVLPLQKQVSNRGLTARALLIEAPTVEAQASHELVAGLFKQHKGLHALALMEGERPVGLISRKTLQDLFLQIFFRDIYGGRPCRLHANPDPLLVDIHTPIENLTEILTAADQRYLSEGFIITEGGQYRGLGTGADLVRMVTEARIEAARHANPLTFLPGNIPITLHIQRLLDNQQDFIACYADLNQFKAFNDHYGYWRGDAVIRLQAECLQAVCDPRRDFIGHVGGDDFVLLLQSPDWHERLERSVQTFNRKALELYDQADQIAGGVHAEDRNGQLRFHPCTSVSLGVVKIAPGRYADAESVANAAASAKHHAKQSRSGLYLLEPAPQTAPTSPLR